MNIYYPSVERGATQARRERHAKVADYLSEKGAILFGRPSLGGSNRMSWLKEAEGVVVERANFTKQIERECLYAAHRLGKDILILMDRATTGSAGEARRQPSERFRELVAQPESDPRARIVNSGPTVKPIPPLAYVQSAIHVYLAGALGYTSPVHADRLLLEPEPFLDEEAGREYDEEYEASLRAVTPPPQPLP